MKIFSWIVLVLVLSIPLDKWKQATEHERETLRMLTINEHCRDVAEKTGCRKFRIWETIKDGIWELHISPVNTEV